MLFKVLNLTKSYVFFVLKKSEDQKKLILERRCCYPEFEASLKRQRPLPFEAVCDE